MITTSSMESHVGQVVSLAALGRDTTGTIVSKLWSPSLGEVLRVSEGHHGQPDSTILLYGEQRTLVISDRTSHRAYATA